MRIEDLIRFLKDNGSANYLPGSSSKGNQLKMDRGWLLVVSYVPLDNSLYLPMHEFASRIIYLDAKSGAE